MICHDALRLVVIHHPECEVKSMCSDVYQRAASLLRLVREYAPCRYTAATNRVGLRIIDITKHSVLAELFQCEAVCAITVLISDGKQLAAFLQASIIFSASSVVAAMGFSHITCFPASNAATLISQ